MWYFRNDDLSITAWNYSVVLAARLFFVIRPIKSLIYGVVVAVDVIDAKAPFWRNDGPRIASNIPTSNLRLWEQLKTLRIRFIIAVLCRPQNFITEEAWISSIFLLAGGSIPYSSKTAAKQPYLTNFFWYVEFSFGELGFYWNYYWFFAFPYPPISFANWKQQGGQRSESRYAKILLPYSLAQAL